MVVIVRFKFLALLFTLITITLSFIITATSESKKEETTQQEEQEGYTLENESTNPTSAPSSRASMKESTAWEMESDERGFILSSRKTSMNVSSNTESETLRFHAANIKYRKMMTPPDSDDKVIKMEHNTSVLQFAQASDAFLILEARIDTEGFTTEIVKQLGKIVNSYVDTENPAVTDDWAFAVTKLSYKELFEPNVKSTREQGFIDAVYNLNVAADAGVQSAYGVLAMLDLIGIPEPEEMEDSNVHLLSRQEKLTRANEKLLSLYGIQDVMATLAIAYGTLSGRISMPMETYDKDAFTDMDAVCENTVSMYHMCAKKNVDTIADEGDERFVKVVRLSNELLDSTGSVFFDEFFAEAVDPLLDENDALYRLEYYRSIAENPMDEQYAQAMHGLGEMYYFGDRAAHVAVDRELAARYFRQAADAGDALAQANYGILLADGIGVNRDVSQALVYFNRAAQQNQAFAFYCLGKMYFTGTGVPQNVTRALECFNEAIALGYAETHSFLGSVYLNGDEGVPVDHEAAFFHFQAAVDGMDGPSSQALLDLGVVHFRGINTPRSCPTALSLFRSVALHPNLLSRLPFSLVKGYECYKKGDYLRAYLNYRLVAELGDEGAQCNAAFLLEHHGDSILKWKWLGLTNSVEDSSKLALREAFTLYSRAAALNDSEAVRKTGACYHEPWAGVCPSNHTRALERYRFAAELGDLEAGFNCGVMFLTGDGVPQDFVAARNCYAKCSEAVFPANVPCALALVGLDILEAIGAVVVKMLEFVL